MLLCSGYYSVLSDVYDQAEPKYDVEPDALLYYSLSHTFHLISFDLSLLVQQRSSLGRHT
jgi:hypothetical protein